MSAKKAFDSPSDPNPSLFPQWTPRELAAWVHLLRKRAAIWRKGFVCRDREESDESDALNYYRMLVAKVGGSRAEQLIEDFAKGIK